MNPDPCFARTIRLLVGALAMLILLTVNASAEWKEKVLYSFQGGNTDGYNPAGGVVFDQQGNLYGATTGGGSVSCAPIGYECGTVFELTPPTRKGGSWTETLIYQFQGEASKDGSVPTGGVIFDTTGNLYGVTAYGGTGDCVLLGIKGGCGTVYELSPPTQQGGAWTEAILYSLQGGTDGYFPWGDLVFDKDGDLYGATQFGGGKGKTCNLYYGGNCGTVFELRPPKQKGGKWTEKILHSFAGGGDGANPSGGLVLDSKGAIYGTTYSGGNQGCHYQDEIGCGIAFKLSPPAKQGGAWVEEHLHVFTGGDDGGQPSAGLIFDAMGSLYSVAGGGNVSGGGIVFLLTEANSGRWKENVLHWFSDNFEGPPLGGVVLDSAGNLYGTTIGGDKGAAVFQLRPPKDDGDAWTLTILHMFTGLPDGIAPDASVVFDKLGNLYSTTQKGGTGACSFYGCGTVFEVSP